MVSGRPRLQWAAKARAAAAFCLAGAVGGTGLYFGNLAYVRVGDEAARSAAAARQAAASLQAPRELKPTSKRQAATDLAGLLSQSVADRSAIIGAVSDLDSCGPLLSEDQTTFQQAASSRRSLINELTSLGLDRYLPAVLLSDLTGAWQAARQADLDFAQWAFDEISERCTQNDTADPSFQAATGPDNQATVDKRAFVALWNPIASEYGLTTYLWYQI